MVVGDKNAEGVCGHLRGHWMLLSESGSRATTRTPRINGADRAFATHLAGTLTH